MNRILIACIYIISCLWYIQAQTHEIDFFDPPGDVQLLPYTHPSIDIIHLHTSRFKPKVGGIDFDRLGNLYVCTWDSIGAVYKLENIQTNDTNRITVTKIAHGLCEPLGLKVVNNKLYVLQKSELTELIDSNGDGFTDTYKTLCQSFDFSGNYHEFAFGLLYKDGWFYATLSGARRTQKPPLKGRSTAIRIDTSGKLEIIAHGLRSPNGIGADSLGNIFINDNQGEWLPASKMVWLKEGAFYGFKGLEENYFLTHTQTPKPPVVWMPHYEIGNSPTQIVQVPKGVYKGQLLFGDVTHGGVKRAYIEKIDTVWQGVVFPFTQGLEGGINRMVWTPDGDLVVGAVGSIGNWAQAHKSTYGLQKLHFNGTSAFEILKIASAQNGFTITFTQPLAKQANINPNDIKITQWRYESTHEYGGLKLDIEELAIKNWAFNPQRTQLYVWVDGMKENRVLHFKLPNNWQSESTQKIWSTNAWFTLNKIPDYPLPFVTIVTPTEKVAINKKITAPKPSYKKTETPTSQPATILTGKALISKSGCYQCHAENEKIIGPSFTEVARKYGLNPSAPQVLYQKILKGSKGVWGEEAMPGQTHLTTTEIKACVEYILGLNP